MPHFEELHCQVSASISDNVTVLTPPLVFTYRKDYDVMYGNEEVTISVFQLLGIACRELMSLSTRIKEGQSQMHLQTNTTPNRMIYYRILWSEYCFPCFPLTVSLVLISSSVCSPEVNGRESFDQSCWSI